MLAAVGWRLIGEGSRMCSLSGLMTSSWFRLNHVPLNKAPRAHLKSVWQSAELVKSMETTAEDNPAKHDRAVILRAAETHDFTVEVIKQEACKTLPGTKLCQGTPACTEASVLHIEDRRKIKTCKKHETRLLSPSKRNGFLLTPGARHWNNRWNCSHRNFWGMMPAGSSLRTVILPCPQSLQKRGIFQHEIRVSKLKLSWTKGK